MELKTRRMGGVGGLAVVASAVTLGGVFVALGQPETRPATPPRPGTPAQPARPGTPTDPQAQQRMEKAKNPAPEHKKLDTFVGEWEGEVKMWMEPGASPMEARGTIKREWVLGNRFVSEEVEAAGEMGRFEGLGFMGYNTLENKYESFWIDDQMTFMVMGAGNYDESAKTFTFEGECPNPFTGKRTKSRHVIDVSDPERHVMTGYGTGPDGKEFKNLEGIFEKK